MSLFFFPRRQGPANAVRPKPPFALLDEVRLPGVACARAAVIAIKEPRPGLHQVLTIDRFGVEAWLAATVLRPAHFELRVIDGGLSGEPREQTSVRA